MKFFKRADILIIAVLITISLATWMIYRQLNSDSNVKAEIYYYSQLVCTVDLDEGIERLFYVDEEPDVIFHLFEDGSICFEESDCPDKVCVKTGRLHLTGEYAACLPNGLILKIVPKGERSEDDPDLVIGY